MDNSFHGTQPQAAQAAPTPLPGIESFISMNNFVACQSCRHMFADLQQLQAHQSQCRLRAHVYQSSGRRTARHDSMHSVHSLDDARGWSMMHSRQFPPSPSSVASESDSAEMIFTPDSSRASSVSLSHHGSRRTSRAENKVAKRNRKHSPEPVVAEHDKKAKKTKKEKMNRGNQSAVMARMEDTLQHYCGWERIEQSGGNGNSAGLTSCKINVLRAFEATNLVGLHRARCAAIRSGTLAAFEHSQQQMAEHALKAGTRPFEDSFLELPPGEVPCRHEDTKSKECSAHGHPDWRECRKTRMQAIFRRNEDAYITSLGMTRQEALYGARAAPLQAQPTLLPHRQSRH